MERTKKKTEDNPPDALEQLLSNYARRFFEIAAKLGVSADASAARDSQFAMVAAIVLRDPQVTPLIDAFANHAEFSRFVPSADAPVVQMRSSLGLGGGVRLEVLPVQLLLAAWFRGHSTEKEYVSNCVGQLRSVRGALAGKEAQVFARVSFCGVLLPGSQVYEFGEVRLRSKHKHEYQQVPQHLADTIGGSDGVVVSRGGDVVAEVKVSYLVEAACSEPWLPTAHGQINEESVRLRASLILALRSRQRAHVLMKFAGAEWDDPLFGTGGSWSFADAMLGILPTQLSAQDVEQWQRWYRHLASAEGQKIRVAISRVARAVLESRDAADVLIDSVIAWENLFGSKDGELSFRITPSLAILLESEPAKRRELRSKLSKIYTVRSKLVHGSGELQPNETAMCFEALDIAIRAVRTLFEEKNSVLRRGDSVERGLVLILGESEGR